MDAFMSAEFSWARSTLPFAHTVASARWGVPIAGFCSSSSSRSTRSS